MHYFIKIVRNRFSKQIKTPSVVDVLSTAGGACFLKDLTRLTFRAASCKGGVPMSKLLDWVLAVLKLFTVLVELALLLTSL